MELDLQSLFGQIGLHVTWCAQLYSLAETPQPHPHPGFRICIHLIRLRIRIQHFWLNTDPDPDLRVFMTKHKKIYSWQKKLNFIFHQKLQFIYPKASIKDVQVTKEAISSQREQPALQNMKFRKHFLLLWVIFALLDPDSDSEYGSGSTDLIESGSNPDPEPCPHPPRFGFVVFVGAIVQAR